MKKGIAALAAALLCLTALCAALAEPLSTDMTPEDIWAQMAQANQTDALVAGADRLAFDATLFDENGETAYARHYYIDGNAIFATDTDGNVQTATAQGNIYGYDAEGLEYFTVFVPEEFGEAVHEAYCADLLMYDWTYEDEQIVAVEELEDELLVTTYTAGLNVYARYQVDMQTARVNRCDEYVVDENGEQKPYASTASAFGVEAEQANPELYEQTHGEGRTVTLVFDPDTEQERSYEMTTKDGVTVVVLAGVYPGYERYYADRACTQPVDAPARTGDVTYYLTAGK